MLSTQMEFIDLTQIGHAKTKKKFANNLEVKYSCTFKTRKWTQVTCFDCQNVISLSEKEFNLYMLVYGLLIIANIK